jgi:large subunit ribosomal protein L4
MTHDLYNWKNEKVGTVELPESLFGVRWNERLIHQILVAQQANARDPWAHVKDRSEVRGGGKKPWRQKGTGRARHGSSRSPIWVGGGKAHGPRNERSYEQKVNKKMRRTAVASLLSHKLKEGMVKFFDTLTLESPKTKLLHSALASMIERPKHKKKFDVLLIPAEHGSPVIRAAANLQKTKVLQADSLNVYDLANYKHIFIEAPAVAVISKTLSRT